MTAIDIPAFPAPTAPAVAEWLLGEAHSHRMPPVLSVETQSENVVLAVDPSEDWYWGVWSNLLKVDADRTTVWDGRVTAHGEWRGVHVVLTGLDVASSGGAR